MKIDKPTIKDLSKALTAIKRDICDEYVEHDDDAPHIEVTLACDETGFALQTGDNSFSGPAYFYRNWGVSAVYRDSNCRELAKDLIDQCEELACC